MRNFSRFDVFFAHCISLWTLLAFLHAYADFAQVFVWSSSLSPIATGNNILELASFPNHGSWICDSETHSMSVIFKSAMGLDLCACSSLHVAALEHDVPLFLAVFVFILT